MFIFKTIFSLLLLLPLFAFGGSLEKWITPERFERAAGKTREEIFAEFDNTLQPVGTIPLDYAALLDPALTNATLYCGEAYFLDHALNHHPELATNTYSRLQETITQADDVKLDTRAANRRGLMFIKGEDAPYTIAIIGIGKRKGEKIALYKTFFQTPKKPYPRILSIKNNTKKETL